MHGARAARRGGPGGFTLLAILVVLAALTLVVGMALQRGEDERRSAYLVQHEALALSAAEYGLDRTRAYVGAILNQKADLDEVLDPALDTDCGALPSLDGGTAEDHLPAFDGGTRVALGSANRPFLRFPYDPDGDGEPEGAYLVRIEDNDDDADSTAFSTSTNNNVGSFGCREGSTLLGQPARTNPVRDRDRTVMVTVVGISPGTELARAQARKVVRARIGSPPAAGIISGGTIDLKGAAHVCGAYGSISVSDGGFEDGCVCGGSCKGGPAHQSCGSGNTCNVQVSNSTCGVDFGGGGGTCTTEATIPPPPKVEVWSRLNAPPACPASSPECTPFYFLRAVKTTGPGATPKAQVWMWNYEACENPQAFSRIHYPQEPLSPAAACWKLVYDGTSGCPGDRVRMADEPSLRARNPSITTCTSLASVVWRAPDSNTSLDPTNKSTPPCDNATTLYPVAGDDRYKRHWLTGGEFTYQPFPAQAPIPRGVWLVDGHVTFTADMPMPNSGIQGPVTLLSTGNVVVENNTTVYLKPANRDVALLAGRDLRLRGGNSLLLTCGDPNTVLTGCPSAAIMVYEQFTMGSNTHLQGQLVVENAGTCSPEVSGKAVSNSGNATISVPGMPPIYSLGGATVLSWGESAL